MDYPTRPATKSRILVIDDDPQVLALFGRILEKGGYEVLLAASGKDVMTLIQQNVADAVVLDLSTPEPDGFDLLKKLRTSVPGLPVLVVSGYLQGVLLKAAELLGATATLSKTDAPKHLLQTVSDLLQAQPRRP